MSEKRFEDDGVEHITNYNYSLLDTHYEFDGKRIIEWNKHSSNAEYTNLERIAEILNIKQMRLESLMKHREEVGKLFDRINEQQATINEYKENWDDMVKLATKTSLRNVELDEQIGQLRKELNDCEKFRYQVFKRMGELNDE